MGYSDGFNSVAQLFSLQNDRKRLKESRRQFDLGLTEKQRATDLANEQYYAGITSTEGMHTERLTASMAELDKTLAQQKYKADQVDSQHYATLKNNRYIVDTRQYGANNRQALRIAFTAKENQRQRLHAQRIAQQQQESAQLISQMGNTSAEKRTGMTTSSAELIADNNNTNRLQINSDNIDANLNITQLGFVHDINKTDLAAFYASKLQSETAAQHMERVIKSGEFQVQINGDKIISLEKINSKNNQAAKDLVDQKQGHYITNAKTNYEHQIGIDNNNARINAAAAAKAAEVASQVVDSEREYVESQKVSLKNALVAQGKMKHDEAIGERKVKEMGDFDVFYSEQSGGYYLKNGKGAVRPVTDRRVQDELNRLITGETPLRSDRGLPPTPTPTTPKGYYTPQTQQLSTPPQSNVPNIPFMGTAHASGVDGEPIVESPTPETASLWKETNYEHYKNKILGGIGEGVKNMSKLYGYHPYNWNIYDAIEDIPNAVNWLRSPHIPEQTAVGKQEAVDREKLLGEFGGSAPQRDAATSSKLGVSRPKGGNYLSSEQLAKIQKINQDINNNMNTTANLAVEADNFDIFTEVYDPTSSSVDTKQLHLEQDKVNAQIRADSQARIVELAKQQQLELDQVEKSYTRSLSLINDSIGNLGDKFKTSDRKFMALQINDTMQSLYGSAYLSNPANDGSVSQHANNAASMMYHSQGEISAPAAINAVYRQSVNSWSAQQAQLVAKAESVIAHKVKDLPYQVQQQAVTALKASFDQLSHDPDKLNAALEKIIRSLQ